MNKMNRIYQMVAHPKEAQEFSLCCQAILPIMTDPQETRDKKRAALNMMVNELSEKTFRLKPIAEQIMDIINMKRDVCEECLDSESQTDGILEWLPRMKAYRGILFEEVKKHRVDYQLKI